MLLALRIGQLLGQEALSTSLSVVAPFVLYKEAISACPFYILHKRPLCFYCLIFPRLCPDLNQLWGTHVLKSSLSLPPSPPPAPGSN